MIGLKFEVHSQVAIVAVPDELVDASDRDPKDDVLVTKESLVLILLVQVDLDHSEENPCIDEQIDEDVALQLLNTNVVVNDFQKRR